MAKRELMRLAHIDKNDAAIGEACKLNDKPIPMALKGVTKVSTTSITPVGDKVGLPVGTLVYNRLEMFSQTKTPGNSKVTSFRGSFLKAGNKWRYSSECARIGFSNELPSSEYLLPSKVIINSAGAIQFTDIFVGKHSFEHGRGFKFDVEASSETINTFAEAFLPESGEMELYLLKEKIENRAVYELRSELIDTEASNTFQLSVRFLLYNPDETIPADAVIQP